jgi:RND family efflux transporter MFP subunit
MNKLSSLKKPKFFIPLIVIVALAGFFVVRGRGAGGEGIETARVVRTNISNVVNETGIVEAAREVVLTFGGSGRVGMVNVEEGQRVEVGEELAILTGGSEYAGLIAARSNLRAQQAILTDLIAGASDSDSRVANARLKTAELALESAEATQNLTIENARRQLLSNDLRAYLEEGAQEEGSNSYIPPTISGTYNGDEEGEYVLELYSSNAQSGYSFRYSGIEQGVGSVSTIAPEPLGKKGLFIQFPDNFARRFNLEWVIPVPNNRSVTYTQFKNAYDSALESRTQAIAQAEANLSLAEAERDRILAPVTSPNLESQRAAVAQAELALAQAEAAYQNARIIAPFSGVITDISITLGERISPGAFAMTLMTDNEYEVVLNVPEADIAMIEIGDEAEITFDAYDDLIVSAKVARIAPRARTVEGVTVIEVSVQFSGSEELIRPGFTADVDLYAAERTEVLAVPTRAIIEKGGQNFVRVAGDDPLLSLESLSLVVVETGLRGAGGLVEIVSGLEEGDTVITFVPADLRGELEAREQAAEAI